MTGQEREARITQYMVNCVPGERLYALYVEFRGHRDGVDWYSVTNGWPLHTGGTKSLDAHGQWVAERKPTRLSPSWQKARQFTFERAVEIAHQYAHEVTVNGFTVADGLRMVAARQAKEARRAG